MRVCAASSFLDGYTRLRPTAHALQLRRRRLPLKAFLLLHCHLRALSTIARAPDSILAERRQTDVTDPYVLPVNRCHETYVFSVLREMARASMRAIFLTQNEK